MPDLVLHDVSISYDTAGDGFPLLLMPGSDGTAAVWDPYVPLLAELCRTITYAVPAVPQPTALALLSALLDRLHLERVYLACHVEAWSLAVQYAVRARARLEALVFLSTHEASLPPDRVANATLAAAPLHTLTVPACVLLEDASVAGWSEAERLTTHLPLSTRIVLSPAQGATPPGTPNKHLGHAMLRFLLHCERQRNLVRGASFLL